MPHVEQLVLIEDIEEEDISLYAMKVYACPYCGARDLDWDEKELHLRGEGRCDSYYL